MALYTGEEGLPAAKFLLGVVVEAVIERLLLAPRPRGSADAPKLVLPANSYTKIKCLLYREYFILFTLFMFDENEVSILS